MNSLANFRFLSVVERMFVGMDWFGATADQLDRGFDHFGGLSSAAAAEICCLIQAVDVSQVWMTDRARTLTEWVGLRLRVRHATARQLVSVARRLVDLPVLSARFACGDLSVDQVDAISRMATPDTEETLIEEALGLSNVALDRAARRADPPSEEMEQLVWERRRLVRQWNLDESELKFWGNLPAVAGQIFDTAIDQNAADVPANPITGVYDPYETRSADGLVQLAATTSIGNATPPQVSVHVDYQTLVSDTPGVGELASGGLVANQTARRLACDAVVEAVIHKDSTVVGVGRNTRSTPGWLRRLVHHRDGGHCRFPGCGNRRWLQVHHKHHWVDGGPTNLDNLILLCGFHHRFIHEHQWHLTTSDDGQVVFRKPDWTPHPKPQEQPHPRNRQAVATYTRPT